ncbi:DUF1129 family protein [Candidatus Contubernalis alkaliaceticus]|uniref:DUF1129 family protein n=1 Tax=Candidatus Contubernalis alkaliaceticus TaxID=338645 RepID=UPI001F4C256E|nr:DUF1129 family protein [Candidatus Contubernalis alkalaceticus]UNC93236.1 DUF1129 family protein [Candidatus Contubernalis alkalaceticus]
MNKLAKELLKKNISREKAISDENKEIYTNMVVYLRGSDLTEYNQEAVREDIIELILDGQQRGDNIQKVMGGRYKEICDEIIEAMPKKTKKDRITEYVGTSLNALWILGVIALVKNLTISLVSDEAEFNFILTVGDIITILAIILIANVIVWFITKTVFDTKKNNKVASFWKSWLIATAIFAVLIFSGLYFRTIIVSIPLWLGAIIVLFIFIIGKIVSERT